MHKGVKVHWLRGTVPTPLVPFWVRQVGATAGIVVTASHNPKDDNGFKVYWSEGCQIVAPRDQQIAAAIDANAEPWSAYDAMDKLTENELVCFKFLNFVYVFAKLNCSRIDFILFEKNRQFTFFSIFYFF